MDDNSIEKTPQEPSPDVVADGGQEAIESAKKDSLAKICWQLFSTFFKIGLFTFGGGYAMISLIEREIVEKKRWISHAELLNLLSVAESTPGPIAVNSSTYIGVLRGGVLAGICATLGCVLPSFIIIYAISFFLEAFKAITLVQYAFWGIRAGVAVLILKAAIKLFSSTDKSVLSILIMLSAFFVLSFTDFGAIYILLIAAAITLIYRYTADAIVKRRAKK